MRGDRTISFRPVTDDDYEYLYDLNRRTMRTYAEQTYGAWDEAVSRRIFAERWRPDTMQIVLIDGQDGGLLELISSETVLHLANIRVAPEYQGQGIGARLVSGVLTDAHSRGLSVALRVLKVNPARRLYERCGFAVVGETETHHLMEAHPPSLQTRQAEAYRRLAQLHYALSVADSVTASLHQRAIDDLMDVLDLLEPSMPPRSGPPAGKSTEQ